MVQAKQAAVSHAAGDRPRHSAAELRSQLKAVKQRRLATEVDDRLGAVVAKVQELEGQAFELQKVRRPMDLSPLSEAELVRIPVV